VSAARPPCSLPPLASFLCWSGDVETRRPLNLAWMLAFMSQNCRVAMDGTPELLVLLSAAVAVRGMCKVSAVAPRTVMQGQ
jgi:hypothetical protein